MAIIKTCKLSVYVMEKNLSGLMDFLQKNAAMEIIERNADRSDSGYALQRAEKALEITNRKPYKKSRFFRKPSAHISSENERQSLRNGGETVEELIGAYNKIELLQNKASETEKNIAQLMDYADLDCSTEEESRFCRFAAGECSEDGIKMLEDSGVCVDVIKKEKRRAVVWIAYLKAQDISEVLSKAGFKKCENSISPKMEIEALKADREDISENIECEMEKLDVLCRRRTEIELYYDRICVKDRKYKQISMLEATKKVYIITGYVPENSVEELVRELEDRFSVSAEIEMPEEGEILPVYFENNAIVAPVEEITASYAMPASGDIDPNPVTAVFYYWFFGMMFSDAGYGALMMLVCGILGFSGLADENKRKSYRLFFWCGVSTTLWGIAYGSFFGDLIGVISAVFGSGKTEFAPILIDPVNQALQLLIISVAFGIVHLVTALSIKFHGLWSTGNKTGAVCDVGFWITAFIGVSSWATGAFLNIKAIEAAGLGISFLSGVGLVLTGGRDRKNPVMKLIGGVMKLYDITGYVGDVLSYSRLMALGLATGVIASVVNVLASLGGGGAVGAVTFAVIAVLGHSMNLAINMLGAYVHTNRLQYVEFFQKFYQGGGRRFRPFKIETKYYDLDI